MLSGAPLQAKTSRKQKNGRKVHVRELDPRTMRGAYKELEHGALTIYSRHLVEHILTSPRLQR